MSSENLMEKARQIRNDYYREYLKEWRAKNPKKVRKYNQSYWLRRAKELQENQVIN